MHYQTFGRRTGLRVSELALGTAGFGAVDQARPVFEAFLSAGGTTVDTSSMYQDGQAETVLGELFGDRRDDLVVVTKYSGTRDPHPRPGTTGNGRKTMIRSLEASLRRLDTDHVDVFMPHFPDGLTPVEEILRGLDDLVRSGKVLHGALSNFPAWRVAGAAVLGDLRGFAPLAGIQTEYSLAERAADRELLPMAEAHGLGVLVYSPLAGGLLTGKYRHGGTGRLSARGDVEGTRERTAVVDAVLEVAAATGATPVQVSLAWLRQQSARSTTALVPVLGPRTAQQLQEYLGGLSVQLDDASLRRLDETSAVRLGPPHDDTAGALRLGADGDRTLVEPPAVPVV